MSPMLDTPPKKIGHRRARSEFLTLPDDMSFDSDLGVVVMNADGASFSDDTEEDLLSLYLDMDKFGSSAQVVEPLGTVWKNESMRHQHSHSMDGSVNITEMLMSGNEYDSVDDRIMDLVERMKIQCDVCEKAPATLICCADEAALCANCDLDVYAANKLASKTPMPDKAVFIFCVEDRAPLCIDCDEATHAPNTRSANPQRFLATGIRVSVSSTNCSNDVETSHFDPSNQPDVTIYTYRCQA
ncbi:hypothetical protein Bca101_017363 [Brassica carinata]